MHSEREKKNFLHPGHYELDKSIKKNNQNMPIDKRTKHLNKQKLTSRKMPVFASHDKLFNSYVWYKRRSIILNTKIEHLLLFGSRISNKTS